jgi:hypothetical protein
MAHLLTAVQYFAFYLIIGLPGEELRELKNNYVYHTSTKILSTETMLQILI